MRNTISECETILEMLKTVFKEKLHKGSPLEKVPGEVYEKIEKLHAALDKMQNPSKENPNPQ